MKSPNAEAERDLSCHMRAAIPTPAARDGGGIPNPAGSPDTRSHARSVIHPTPLLGRSPFSERRLLFCGTRGKD